MTKDMLAETVCGRLQGAPPLDAVVAFDLGAEGSFTIDATGPLPRRDDGAEPGATLEADPATLAALLDGSLSPTAAYLSGRIRAQGSMDLLMRLAAALDEG